MATKYEADTIASAQVGLAEYNAFKQKYDPLLQQMRDKSLTADVGTTLRARANADTMQALTSQPSYQMAQGTTGAGEMAQALQGQLGVANTSAKKIENTMQTNVLGVARGQAADAQTGMAQVSRLATSEALERAKAKQTERSARMGALGQLAGAFLMQGAENKRTEGTNAKGETVKGSFFSPVDSQGNRISSFSQRWDNI